MKKLLSVVAVAMLVGAVSSWADTTNVLTKFDITIKGKLSPSKTAVTAATLAGNTNAVSVLKLEIIGSDTVTNTVIGQVVGSNIVVFLEETAFVDLTPAEITKDKSVSVFEGTHGTASNAVLLVTSSSKEDKATNTIFKATLEGIWADEVSVVKGSIASVKVKK